MSLVEDLQAKVERQLRLIDTAESRLNKLRSSLLVATGEDVARIEAQFGSTNQRLSRARKQLTTIERDLADAIAASEQVASAGGEASTGARAPDVLDLTDLPSDPVNEDIEIIRPIDMAVDRAAERLPRLTVEVSALQKAVADLEAQLADAGAESMQLWLDEPALVRPSALNFVWAEAGKSALARMTAAAATADDRAVATKSDSVPGRRPSGLSADDELAALRANNYDTHIALQHELVGPLLFNTAQTTERGDEFGYGDTFAFSVDPDPELLQRGTSDLAAERDSLWQFAFSPHRFDIALSLQSVRAIPGWASLQLDSSDSVLSYGVDSFVSPGGKELRQQLGELFATNALLEPPLTAQFDPTTLMQKVTAPSGLVPSTRARRPDTVPRFRGENLEYVKRHRLVEASGSYALSALAVQESARLEQSLFRGAGDIDSGSAGMSLLPVELMAGDKPDQSDSADLETLQAAQAAELRRERLVALSDLEQTLAERGGDGPCDMLRGQTTTDSQLFGALVIADRPREYSLSEPSQSLVAQIPDANKLSDELLEQRVRRQSDDAKLSRKVPFTFTKRLNRLDESRLRRADRQRQRSSNLRSLQLGGEPRTTKVLRVIEDEDEVRQESSQRAKRSRITLADDNDDDVDDKLTITSQIKRKLTARDKGPVVDDDDDDDDDGDDKLIGTLEEQLGRTDAPDEDELLDDNDIEDLEEFSEQLAQGAPLQLGSDALFERKGRFNYGGPFIGVPSSVSQASLLAKLDANRAGDWRANARTILQLALYFKLVPKLYSIEFPAEAVDWLRDTLSLICLRLATEQDAHAQALQIVEQRMRDIGIIDDSSMTTTTRPSVCVVDIEESIGREVLSSDSDFTPLDRATLAVIYATHALQPRSIDALLETRPLLVSDAERMAQLEAECYPARDTYLADVDALTTTLYVIGATGVDKIRRGLGALVDKPTTKSTVESNGALARVILDTLDAKPQLLGSVQRLIYDELVEGARNRVVRILVPPPPPASERVDAISQRALRSAIDNYLVLHDNDNGELDPSRSEQLVAARVRDSRERAQRLLLDRCSAPAYTAALQQYASAHFPPHASSLEWRINERLPTVPFSVSIDGAVQVDRTLVELLSSDWLGSGRVQLATAPTRVTRTPARRWRPFYNLLAPARMIDWLADTAVALSNDNSRERLATLLSTYSKRLARALRVAGANDTNEYARIHRYWSLLAELQTDLRNAGVAERRDQTDIGDSALDRLLRTAANDMRDNALLFVDTRPFGIDDDLPAPTTLPFADLLCNAESGDDDDDATPAISADNRRALAEVYYRAAEQLRLFQCGYVSSVFASRVPLQLDTAPTSFADYVHVHAQLTRAIAASDNNAPSLSELRFAVERECVLLHTGRTLWFEEALVHDDAAALFAKQVRESLVFLYQTLKNKKRVAVIDYGETADYAAAVPDLVLRERLQPVLADGQQPIDDNVVALDQRANRLLTRAAQLGKRAKSVRTADGDDDAQPLPSLLGNHKLFTATSLELASQLLRFTEQTPFPRRRYIKDDSRLAALIPLHQQAKQVLSNESELANLIKQLNDPQQVPPTRRRSVELLTDYTTVRNDIIIDRRNQALRELIGDDAPSAEEINAVLTRVQRANNRLRNRLNADALFGADYIANLPKTASDNPSEPTRLAAFDAIEERASELIDARQQLVDTVYEQVRDSLVRNLALPFLLTDDNPLVRESIDALRTAYETALDSADFNDDRALDEEEQQRSLNQATAVFNTEVERRPEIVALYAKGINRVRSLVTDYRDALESLNYLRSLSEEVQSDVREEKELQQTAAAAVDMPEPIDVVTELEQRYARELDRLRFVKLFSSVSAGRKVELEPPIAGSSTSISALTRKRTLGGASTGVSASIGLVALLMPAAIERAKLSLWFTAPRDVGVNVVDPYTAAYRGDVPQSVRLAELVRRYCLYRQVPFPSAGSSSQTLADDYDKLLRAALTDRPTELAAESARSALLSTIDSVRRDELDDSYISQHYSPGNGVHHQLPFGADCVVAVLWVRVMRFYLQYQRVHELERNLGRAPALASLASLYESANEPVYRALTRQIAELPRAADRLQLYLAMLCAPIDARLVDVLPTRSARQLNLDELRQSRATAMPPTIDEMRAIDVRALGALLTGVDYSPLRRRERNDQFDCELRESSLLVYKRTETTDSVATTIAEIADKVEKSATSKRYAELARQRVQRTRGIDDPEIEDVNLVVDDDGLYNTDDLRDAVQQLDPDYAARRALTSKAVLIDAYYRMVLERLFTPDTIDLATVERNNPQAVAALNRPLRASDVEIVYRITLRVGKDKLTSADAFRRFVAARSYPNQLVRDTAPFLRTALLRGQATRTERITVITLAKMRTIYKVYLRDKRYTVYPATKKAAGPRRTLLFEPRGAVHNMSPGAAMHELTSGSGLFVTQRALLSLALRNFVFALQQRTIDDKEKSPGLRKLAADRFDQYAADPTFGTHGELAFNYIPRQSLIGAMQRLATGQPRAQRTLLSALLVVSRRVDNQAHLWHDDVRERTAEDRDQQERTTRALRDGAPINLDELERVSEDIDAQRAIELAVAQQESAVVANGQSLGAPSTGGARGPLRIEQRLMTDPARWQTNVERQLTELFNSQRPLALTLGVDLPRTKQVLLTYESMQLFGSEQADGELAELLGTNISSILPVLRSLFEQRFDRGGNDANFSVEFVASQADAMAAALQNERPAASESDANLLYLLARTEAERRKRWRAVAALQELDTSSAPLANDREPDDERDPSDPVNAYSYWSAQFYTAIDTVLGKVSVKLRTLLSKYVDGEIKRGDQLDAQAQAAQARLNAKGAINRNEVEKFLPVYALLEQLLFTYSRNKRKVRDSAQLHPLVPLIVGPLRQLAVVQLHSVADANGLTLTKLAPAPYITRGRAFTPNEARAEAAVTIDAGQQLLLIHEAQLRRGTKNAKHINVNRVGPPEAYDGSIVVADLIRRVAGATPATSVERIALLTYQK